MRAAAQGKASSRQRVVRKAHSTRAAAAHERNIQTRDHEPCDHQAHHARGQNSSQNPGKVVHRSKSPGRRNGSRNRAKGLRTRSCAIIPDSQSVERRAEGTRESEALKPVQVRCLKETSLPTTPERQASKTFGKLTASSTFPPTAFTTTAFTGVSSSSVSSGSTDDDDDDEDEWVKLPRQHGWALLPRRGLDANTIPHLEPEADPRRRATVSLLFQGHRRRKQGQLGQHRHDDEDASSPADKASATTVRRGRGLSGNASKRPNVPYSTLQAVLFRCTVAKNGWLSSKDSYPVRRLDKSRSVHNATSNRAATL